MFQKRKYLKRLLSLGSNVLVCYRVVLNDDQPIEFADFNEVVSYLSHFRESNVIYKLQLFRVEIYSL